MSAGRHQDVTDRRLSKIQMRKPPPIATEIAIRAMSTATTSSVVAHLGSFILRLRASPALAYGFGAASCSGATRCALLGASAQSPVFNLHAQNHKPAEANRRNDTRGRRPDDERHAGDLADDGKVVGM